MQLLQDASKHGVARNGTADHNAHDVVAFLMALFEVC